jgi:hypothetical protein
MLDQGVDGHLPEVDPLPALQSPDNSAIPLPPRPQICYDTAVTRFDHYSFLIMVEEFLMRRAVPAVVVSALLLFLLFSLAFAQTPQTVTVVMNARLRSGPGPEFPTIQGVQAGTQITVVGTNETGDWSELDNGLWIATFLITTTNSPPLSATTAASPIATPPSTRTASTAPPARILSREEAAVVEMAMTIFKMIHGVTEQSNAALEALRQGEDLRRATIWKAAIEDYAEQLDALGRSLSQMTVRSNRDRGHLQAVGVSLTLMADDLQGFASTSNPLYLRWYVENLADATHSLEQALRLMGLTAEVEARLQATR